MKARSTSENSGLGSNVSVKKLGWLMKDTAERVELELEKTKLRKQIYSARKKKKNNVANSQQPSSYTNPESATLRTHKS